MRVLVACEFSGVVRDAFIRAGHQAMSCDLLPSERPGPHYQGDVRDVLSGGWDLMIAHPACTFLSRAGARCAEHDESLDQAYRKGLSDAALARSTPAVPAEDGLREAARIAIEARDSYPVDRVPVDLWAAMEPLRHALASTERAAGEPEWAANWRQEAGAAERLRADADGQGEALEAAEWGARAEAIRDVLDSAGAARSSGELHPGEPHEPRAECRRCGVPLTLNVSLIAPDERVEIVAARLREPRQTEGGTDA